MTGSDHGSGFGFRIIGITCLSLITSLTASPGNHQQASVRVAEFAVSGEQLGGDVLGVRIERREALAGERLKRFPARRLVVGHKLGTVPRPLIST